MFEKIIGNNKNKEILQKSLQLKNISHSYIFSGIEGIGKKLIAKEFAKKILCLKKEENCSCKSCIEFDTDNNPDFKIIEPDNGKIKIEQIRNLQKDIVEKPIISAEKVYIIDDADLMTKESQNCLLKTLEEPPEYITIILVCSNDDALLTTIKSRCTKIFFKQLETEEIDKYLKQNNIENISLNIKELSQGSIGKLLRLQENRDIYDNLEKILLDLKTKDLIEINKDTQKIYENKEEINNILEYINVILLRLGKENHKYIKCIPIVEETKKRLKYNGNYDMCLDYLFFNMSSIIH